MCGWGAKNYEESADYWVNNKRSYKYMGVDEDNDIISYGFTSCFDGNLIPFNQVAEYLGLPTPDNDSVTSVPVKWTKAMQEGGIPLTVGMVALNYDSDVEITINYIGKVQCLITNDMGTEYAITIDNVQPFPDEETPEQVSQRTEFLSTFQGFLNEDPYVYEGDGVAEDMYDKLKHMFKY